MRRLFRRGRRTGRIQQEPQGESKITRRQSIRADEINGRIRDLEGLVELGLLSQDKVDEFRDKLMEGEISVQEFFTETKKIIDRINTEMRQRREEFARQQEAEEQLQEPQGESKTSRYATQPEVPPVPDDIPEVEAEEVQDDTPVVEADRYTYRVHSMPVATPLLDVVRTIQSEM